MSNGEDDYKRFVDLVQQRPGEARELIQELDYYRDEEVEFLGSFERELLQLAPDLELIESFGGQGQGGSCGIVFRVHGRVLRLEGSWDSWSGSDFRNATLHETEPRQVTAIVYDNSKQIF